MSRKTCFAELNIYGHKLPVWADCEIHHAFSERVVEDHMALNKNDPDHDEWCSIHRQVTTRYERLVQKVLGPLEDVV